MKIVSGKKVGIMEKIVQTAGRDALGDFAPEFARFNDDLLFGENWNNHDIDVKTRSIITVVALMSSGITDSSLKYHLLNAKNHGVTQREIAAIITHTAFYVGWPKGWAVFNLAKEVWQINEGDAGLCCLALSVALAVFYLHLNAVCQGRRIFLTFFFVGLDI